MSLGVTGAGVSSTSHMQSLVAAHRPGPGPGIPHNTPAGDRQGDRRGWTGSRAQPSYRVISRCLEDWENVQEIVLYLGVNVEMYISRSLCSKSFLELVEV